jgi:trans-aconitate 2-methyltransferase
VDAILSTATFHWIADHARLFAALHAALRPGGRLVAQCGGAGNIARVREAIDRTGFFDPGWSMWTFAGPEETEARLRAAGFVDTRAWLQDAPVVSEDPQEYLSTVILGAHLERLPAERRDPFVAAVLAELGPEPVFDYVRLNLDARRP